MTSARWRSARIACRSISFRSSIGRSRRPGESTIRYRRQPRSTCPTPIPFVVNGYGATFGFPVDTARTNALFPTFG